MLNDAGTESVPHQRDSGFMQSHVLSTARPASPLLHQQRQLDRPQGLAVNAFELPPPRETLRLIDDYFSNTGLLFPFVQSDDFLATYHKVAATNFTKVRRSWLGLLNMILAMATSTGYPSEMSYEQRRVESTVFYQRAMMLCEKQIRFGASLETGTYIMTPDLRLMNLMPKLVQFLLLLSQYLQGTESSIQTWNMHGLAVKTAYQLGLHSTRTLQRYLPKEQEVRIRTWYSCVLLDR